MIGDLQLHIAHQELPAAHQVRCGLVAHWTAQCVERVDLALCAARRAPYGRCHFLDYELGTLGHRTGHSQRPRPVQRSRYGTAQRADTQSHHLHLGAVRRRTGGLDGFDNRAEQREFMHESSLAPPQKVNDGLAVHQHVIPCPQLLLGTPLLQHSP